MSVAIFLSNQNVSISLCNYKIMMYDMSIFSIYHYVMYTIVCLHRLRLLVLHKLSCELVTT